MRHRLHRVITESLDSVSFQGPGEREPILSILAPTVPSWMGCGRACGDSEFGDLILVETVQPSFRYLTHHDTPTTTSPRGPLRGQLHKRAEVNGTPTRLPQRQGGLHGRPHMPSLPSHRRPPRRGTIVSTCGGRRRRYHIQTGYVMPTAANSATPGLCQCY